MCLFWKTLVSLCLLLGLTTTAFGQIIDTFDSPMSADGTASPIIIVGGAPGDDVSTQTNVPGVLESPPGMNPGDKTGSVSGDTGVNAFVTGGNELSFGTGSGSGSLNLIYWADSPFNMTNAQIIIPVPFYDPGNGPSPVDLTVTLVDSNNNTTQTVGLDFFFPGGSGVVSVSNSDFDDPGFAFNDVEHIEFNFQTNDQGTDFNIGGETPFQIQQIPEPTSLAIWATASGIGLVVARRRLRRQKS